MPGKKSRDRNLDGYATPGLDEGKGKLSFLIVSLKPTIGSGAGRLQKSTKTGVLCGNEAESMPGSGDGFVYMRQNEGG